MLTPNRHGLRLSIRSGHFTGHTSGYCRGFVPDNVVMLSQDWACGATPQVLLEQAKLPLCITHSPVICRTDLYGSQLAIL
ncbi:hypothetical protein [Porticoccus sp.]|uniref:hypothetical protein n=1 Tax=Porticoccus sp. TaxID=2024853 RepID=UPI003F698F7F